MVIGDGSIITDTALKHCVIGIRVHGPREGSHLEDVVMMGADFYESEEELKANAARACRTSASGAAAASAAPSSTRTRGSATARVLSPDGKPNGDYPHDVMIRDGVLVVPKGAVIPPGTTI